MCLRCNLIFINIFKRKCFCTLTTPSFLKHSGRHVLRFQIVAGTDTAFTHTTCRWINCFLTSYRWSTITYNISRQYFIIQIPQFVLIGKHNHWWVFHRKYHLWSVRWAKRLSAHASDVWALLKLTIPTIQNDYLYAQEALKKTDYDHKYIFCISTLVQRHMLTD